MGKPSVTTATRGADVAIEQGETGFIVPIKNPRLLAEAIERIITDNALAREMGKRAHRRITDLFDENKIVGQQVHIYEELFKKREKTKHYRI